MLDLSKEFDSIDRENLFAEVKGLGFNGSAKNFIKSFFLMKGFTGLKKCRIGMIDINQRSSPRYSSRAHLS